MIESDTNVEWGDYSADLQWGRVVRGDVRRIGRGWVVGWRDDWRIGFSVISSTLAALIPCSV